MPSDKELLDWLEKNFDSAQGQQRCKQSITGWITRYLYWGKRSGGDGNLREAIMENMRAAGVPAVDPFDFPEDHDPAIIAARRASYAKWLQREREKRMAEDAADGVKASDVEGLG